MNTNIKGTPGNGINVGALREFADQVAAKPAAGIATFGVVTTWEGGTRTRARTMPLVLGDTALARGLLHALHPLLNMLVQARRVI